MRNHRTAAASVAAASQMFRVFHRRVKDLDQGFQIFLRFAVAHKQNESLGQAGLLAKLLQQPPVRDRPKLISHAPGNHADLFRVAFLEGVQQRRPRRYRRHNHALDVLYGLREPLFQMDDMGPLAQLRVRERNNVVDGHHGRFHQQIGRDVGGTVHDVQLVFEAQRRQPQILPEDAPDTALAAKPRPVDFPALARERVQFRIARRVDDVLVVVVELV